MLHRFQVAQGLGDARDGRGGAALLSYVDRDERVPTGHPLRKIRQIVNDALYTKEWRTLIAPERLIWASLLQTPFSIRVTPHACLRHDTVVAGADGLQPAVPVVRTRVPPATLSIGKVGRVFLAQPWASVSQRGGEVMARTIAQMEPIVSRAIPGVTTTFVFPASIRCR